LKERTGSSIFNADALNFSLPTFGSLTEIDATRQRAKKWKLILISFFYNIDYEHTQIAAQKHGNTEKQKSKVVIKVL
jgi:hypothetical protein